MNVTIDCSMIRTKEDLHTVLAQALQFPAWYGRNLDALHDCLMAMTGEICLLNWSDAEASLGKYGTAARRAIADAAFKNAKLEITF